MKSTGGNEVEAVATFSSAASCFIYGSKYGTGTIFGTLDSAIDT